MLIVRIFLLTMALLTAPVTIVLARDTKNTFTESQVVELAKKIQDEAKLSANYKAWNQGYDISFKVGVFILSALAAIGAARIAAPGDKPPSNRLKTTNLALTSIIALVAALGFTQFDFAKRHRIWEKRFYALESCEMMLRFAQPDREDFLRQLDAIKKWGDDKNPSEMTASCNAEQKPDKNNKPSYIPENPASGAAKWILTIRPSGRAYRAPLNSSVSWQHSAPR